MKVEPVLCLVAENVAMGRSVARIFAMYRAIKRC
ncbi:Uncharacterised protein [Vibrio cholerae]|nr:Uncharacterised protein [Vibrio cholerae]